MARRTRRRPKVVWLPIDRGNRLGVAPANALTPNQSSHFVANLPMLSGVGNEAVEAFPVVGDTPLNIATTGFINSLADQAGSAYRLRRIVGKLFIGMGQTDLTVGDTSQVIVTAAFIILHVDASGVPLQTPEQYNPSSLEGNRDPWIWRRSWRLQNGNQVTLNGPNSIDSKTYPENTTQYGSVMDGSHVDARTARIVSDEERLFLLVSATNIDGTPDGQTENSLVIVGDFRILASLRTSQGNRRNASR